MSSNDSKPLHDEENHVEANVQTILNDDIELTSIQETSSNNPENDGHLNDDQKDTFIVDLSKENTGLNEMLKDFSPFRQLLHLHSNIPACCDCPGVYTKLTSRIFCANCNSESSDEDITCQSGKDKDKHDPLALASVCLSCRYRLCVECYNSTHKHVISSKCLVVPYEFFIKGRQLFSDLLYGKEFEKFESIALNEVLIGQQLSARVIAKEAHLYFDSTTTQTVRRMMLQLVRQIGDEDAISFAYLCELYAEKIKIDTRQPNNMEITISKYQSLTRWQWLYNLKCWWSYSKSFDSSLMKKSISKIKGKLGNNVGHVFLYIRYLLLMNFILSLLSLLLIVPSLWNSYTKHIQGNEYWGLLSGVGFLNTFFFYSGYSPLSLNSYDMQIGYMLVLICLFLFSILFLIITIDSYKLNNKNSWNNANAKQTPAGILFSSFPYDVNSYEETTTEKKSTLMKIALCIRELKQAKIAYSDRKLYDGPIDPWYFWWFACMIVMGFATFGLYSFSDYMRNKEYSEIWANQVKFIALPLLVSLSKLILAPIIQKIASWEFKSIYYTQNHINTRLMWRAYLLQTVMASVACYSAYTYTYPQNVPSFISRDIAISIGNCICLTGVCVNDVDWSCPCDEGYIASTFYSFIIADFIIHFVFSFLIPSLILSFIYFITMCCGDTGSRIRKKLKFRNNPINEMSHSYYRQLIMWCGLAYAPILPIINLITSFILCLLRMIQVNIFELQPNTTMSISQQQQYARFLTLLGLIGSLVPLSIFLTSKSLCGVYVSSWSMTTTISDYWIERTRSLPDVVRAAFDFLTNTAVLWIFIIIIVVYSLITSTQTSLLEQKSLILKNELKKQEKDKDHLVASTNLVLGGDDAEGRLIFNQWILSLEPELYRYQNELYKLCNGDFIKLAQLPTNHVRAIIRTHPILYKYEANIITSIQNMRICAYGPKPNNESETKKND